MQGFLDHRKSGSVDAEMELRKMASCAPGTRMFCSVLLGGWVTWRVIRVTPDKGWLTPQAITKPINTLSPPFCFLAPFIHSSVFLSHKKVTETNFLISNEPISMASGGTEAFPDLGKHCQHRDCNQLDFLPFTCDGCKQVLLLFCFLSHESWDHSIWIFL